MSNKAFKTLRNAFNAMAHDAKVVGKITGETLKLAFNAVSVITVFPACIPLAALVTAGACSGVPLIAAAAVVGGLATTVNGGRLLKNFIDNMP